MGAGLNGRNGGNGHARRTAGPAGRSALPPAPVRASARRSSSASPPSSSTSSWPISSSSGPASRVRTTSWWCSCRPPSSLSPPTSGRGCRPACAPRSLSSTVCSRWSRASSAWHGCASRASSASALCGLLPLVAGAVLIALGLWLLWVSRKRGGRLWWTLAAPRSAPGRGAVRRLLGRAADQPGHHRHRAPERAGQGRGPRAPAREGHAHHARRSLKERGPARRPEQMRGGRGQRGADDAGEVAELRDRAPRNPDRGCR